MSFVNSRNRTNDKNVAANGSQKNRANNTKKTFCTDKENPTEKSFNDKKKQKTEKFGWKTRNQALKDSLFLKNHFKEWLKDVNGQKNSNRSKQTGLQTEAHEWGKLRENAFG